MSELKRFWHWAINEKPSGADAVSKARFNLGPDPLHALYEAARVITIRGYGERWPPDYDADLARLIEAHPEALRDLSLALHDALEKMREQVPAGHAWTVLPMPTEAERPDFRREYLGEWHRPPPYAEELINSQQRLMGSRQAGKSERIERMREMFESQPLSPWPAPTHVTFTDCGVYDPSGAVLNVFVNGRRAKMKPTSQPGVFDLEPAEPEQVTTSDGKYQLGHGPIVTENPRAGCGYHDVDVHGCAACDIKAMRRR